MTNYFEGCSTLSEAKQRRNQLAKEFHPDNLKSIMQEINAAYEQAQRDALQDGALPDKYHGVKQDAPKVERVEVPVVRYVRATSKPTSSSHGGTCKCAVCGKTGNRADFNIHFGGRKSCRSHNARK